MEKETKGGEKISWVWRVLISPALKGFVFGVYEFKAVLANRVVFRSMRLTVGFLAMILGNAWISRLSR